MPRWYALLTTLLPRRTRVARRLELLDHIQCLQQDPAIQRLAPAHTACRLLWGYLLATLDILGEAASEALLCVTLALANAWTDLLSLAYEDGDDRRDLTRYLVDDAIQKARAYGRPTLKIATWILKGVVRTAPDELLMVIKIAIGRAPAYAATLTDAGCFTHGGRRNKGRR